MATPRTASSSCNDSDDSMPLHSRLPSFLPDKDQTSETCQLASSVVGRGGKELIVAAAGDGNYNVENDCEVQEGHEKCSFDKNWQLRARQAEEQAEREGGEERGPQQEEQQQKTPLSASHCSSLPCIRPPSLSNAESSNPPPHAPHFSASSLESHQMRAIMAMLGFLSSRARLLHSPRLALLSCGIREAEGGGLVDRNGQRMEEWGEAARSCGRAAVRTDVAACPAEEGISGAAGGGGRGSGEAAGGSGVVAEASESLLLVMASMEHLLKRALVAEREAGREREVAQRERVRAVRREEEVAAKGRAIEQMMQRLSDMQKAAVTTGSCIREMQRRLQGMEDEAERQRQRACDNEAEIAKVREELSKLKREVEELVKAQSEVRVLESRMKEMEATADEFMKRLDKLVAAKVDLDKELRQEKATKVQLTQELEDRNFELLALSDEVKDLMIYRDKWFTLQ